MNAVTVEFVHAALGSDAECVLRLCPPDLLDIVRSLCKDGLGETGICFCAKQYVLQIPHVHAYVMAAGAVELNTLEKHPCLVVLFNLLDDAYGVDTARKGVVKAAKLPRTQIQNICTNKKTVDTFVLQLTNRDNHKKTRMARASY